MQQNAVMNSFIPLETHYIPLDCCKTAVPCKTTGFAQTVSARYIKEQIKQKQKEEDMIAQAHAHVSQQPTVALEIQQKDYLLKRLDKAEGTLKEGLREQFGMNEAPGPKTGAELKARLDAGQFTVTLKDDGKIECYDRATSYISWNLIPEDRAGYEAAKTALAAKKQTAVDTIWGLDYATGLAAVQAFEAPAKPTLN